MKETLLCRTMCATQLCLHMGSWLPLCTLQPLHAPWNPGHAQEFCAKCAWICARVLIPKAQRQRHGCTFGSYVMFGTLQDGDHLRCWCCTYTGGHGLDQIALLSPTARVVVRIAAGRSPSQMQVQIWTHNLHTATSSRQCPLSSRCLAHRQYNFFPSARRSACANRGVLKISSREHSQSIN